MWLVGYLYNANGMGTWCWEAANALHEAGEPVTLVCSHAVALPGPAPFAVLRVSPPPRGASIGAKVGYEIGRLSSHGPRVMRDAVAVLAPNVQPILLLNAPEFHDRTIAHPQLVVAWARGIMLREYLARLREQLRTERGHHGVRAALGAIGGWRRDWHGYRNADVVLAVTTPLRDELSAAGVKVELLHPCTRSSESEPSAKESSAPTRLLMIAADLDEPRKRIGWMLDALRAQPPVGCTLALVGRLSSELAQKAESTGIPIVHTGPLLREDALRHMRDHDVLLFASALDDWGFVLTESMAQGLAVVAPAIAPFDEILGDTGATYEPENAEAFRRAIDTVRTTVDVQRLRAWQRARTEFSRAKFAMRLKEIVSQST